MTNGGPVHQPTSREPLRYSTLLVVEGRDMFRCFLALLRELGLDGQIEVRDGGGVPQLYDYLGVLPNISGFDRVTALGVVCDTETDPARAFGDLANALHRAGLPVPAAPLQPTIPPPQPGVTIALLPDAATPGMLETLLWRSLSGDPLVPCVEQYLECVRNQSAQAIAHEDKSRVYAYIAGRSQPWLLLGQAAHAGYFPLASPAFDEIRGFLSGLARARP
ncbi:MAG: hypothetical protein L0212_07275 [Acidobacteria bacterium]|nr:hypothetical protein [Acidobacteriota bacterium]